MPVGSAVKYVTLLGLGPTKKTETSAEPAVLNRIGAFVAQLSKETQTANIALRADTPMSSTPSHPESETDPSGGAV